MHAASCENLLICFCLNAIPIYHAYWAMVKCHCVCVGGGGCIHPVILSAYTQKHYKTIFVVDVQYVCATFIFSDSSKTRIIAVKQELEEVLNFTAGGNSAFNLDLYVCRRGRGGSRHTMY